MNEHLDPTDQHFSKEEIRAGFFMTIKAFNEQVNFLYLEE